MLTIGDEIMHGKRPNHKIKPYVILQYLLKNSDINHIQTRKEIIAYLEECGIEAERRSVYQDIKEINRVALMLENDCSLDEIDPDEIDDEDKLIIYDEHRKGFYVQPHKRKYDLDDIRLLAECVYSAKFIAEGQAKRLVSVVSEMGSDFEAEAIQHDAFLTDRVKTINKSVLNNISMLNTAMSKAVDGLPHIPEKVTFKYLKYSIHDLTQQVERKAGAIYKVNPFRLMINDGNYYLLAIDEKSGQMRNYRVDRMKNVSLTGEKREGEEEFRKIDIRTYAQRTFSMFEGKQEHVTMQFIMPLLDTVIDRFGTGREIQYFAKGEKYFTITADVKITDQFFGWILGFGRKAAILSPQSVVDEFTAYLDKVRSLYEEHADD